MKYIKHFFKSVRWDIMTIYIIVSNVIILIFSTWSLSVLLYSLVIGLVIVPILSYIQKILNDSSYIEDKPKINVAVIAASKEDFLLLKEYSKFRFVEPEPGERRYSTSKRFSVDNKHYYSIAHPNDAHGITVHQIIETENAKANPFYDKILYILRINTASAQNYFVK